MSSKIQQYRGVVVVFILASLLPINMALSQAAAVPSPTITEIDLEQERASRPLVTGLTRQNTDVLVYLDQEFVGLAEVNDSGTETDNFHWQPERALPEGLHSLYVVARDRTSAALSSQSNEVVINILPLAPPTLIAPNEKSVIGTPKPIISGLAPSDSVVHIIIDGVVNGNTGILEHESGTADFSYKPFLNLSVGKHRTWAVATDDNGRQSEPSNIIEFTVEEPMPAPTLLAPVVNSASSIEQPWIVGLAKNDSKIRVFIDHQLNGEFKVENSTTGTANFAYQPFLPLTPGDHLIYVTAVDERGKESQWSNLMSYKAGDPIEPQITDTAATDEEPIVMGEEKIFSERLKELIVLARLFAANNEIVINEEQLSELRGLMKQPEELDITEEEQQLLQNLLESDEGKIIISDEEPEGTPPELDGEDQELDKILGEDESSDATDEETGMIDESRDQQGRLRLNLVIFILFLLAVIIWIFWVNRELIKERREQNGNNNDPSTPRSDSPRAGSGRAEQASSGQGKKDSDQNKFDI